MTRSLSLLISLLLVALGALIVVPADGAVLPVTSDSCGPAPAKPKGGTWVCTFAEDFDGTALDRRVWNPMRTYESGYINGTECYVDDRRTIGVSGGSLHLSLISVPEGTNCVTPYSSLPVNRLGGGVHTRSTFTQTYGRFEIRARFPHVAVKGVQSALWLYPQTNQPLGKQFNGEIDIAEYFSFEPDRVIPNLHYSGSTFDANHTREDCLVGNPWDWHTFTLEWSTSVITISYDGVPCLVDNWKPVGVTKPAPFNTPFFINLTQTAGILDNAYSPAVTPTPATMDVDYVRVWK